MASNYAKHMAQLSARIFGEVVRPTDRPSMKVVKMFAQKPLHKDWEIVEYYPRHVELTYLMRGLRFLGLYRSVAEFCLLAFLATVFTFLRFCIFALRAFCGFLACILPSNLQGRPFSGANDTRCIVEISEEGKKNIT